MKITKYSYKDYIKGKTITNDENSINNIDSDENDMDMIIDNLWLGNYKAAYNKKELDKHNIKYIINITDNGSNLGSMEGKIDDLNGLTVEVITNVSFDDYNEEIRLNPKRILSKYY